MEPKGSRERIDLLQGTLDLLILRTLLPGPAHGHRIVKAIEVGSRAVLRIDHGSLYPALHRLERRGWIRAEWGTSDNNRRAKYYALTRTGRRRLAAGEEKWRKLTGAVGLVLDME